MKDFLLYSSKVIRGRGNNIVLSELLKFSRCLFWCKQRQLSETPPEIPALLLGLQQQHHRYFHFHGFQRKKTTFPAERSWIVQTFMVKPPADGDALGADGDKIKQLLRKCYLGEVCESWQGKPNEWHTASTHWQVG